jgi:hypothetical protein
VEQYAEEPTSSTRLTVEVLTDTGPETLPASIADLTRQELWVALDKHVAEPLDPGRSVRLILSHPRRPTQVADTIVLWHLGKTGNIVVLRRPGFWDPPSRRQHMRLRLAVPVYLKADDGSGWLPTTSVNVGVGGVFCTAAMDLRVAQRLDVEVHLTPDETFQCQAEVARLDPDPNDPVGLQLMAGLHFLDLTPDQQLYLADLISRLARDVDKDSVPRCWLPGADPLLVHVPMAGEGGDDEPEPLVTLDLEGESA